MKKKTGLVIAILLAACSLFTAIAGCALGGWWIVRTAKRDGWPVGAAAEPTVIPEVTSAPEETPAPVETARVADRVEAEIVYENGGYSSVHAVLRGYRGSELLWTRTLASCPATELDAFNDIGLFDDLYLCCNGGTLMALDACTGETAWENGDFGGSVSGFDVDEQRNLYLTGYYGPAFFLADIDGNTLCRMENFNPEYYWPNQVRKLDENAAEVVMTMGPEGEEGEFRFRVERENGVWRWSGPDGAQPVSHTDERAWKTAYANWIRSQEEYDGYCLLDAGIGVPLLYLKGMSTAQGDLLCVYDEKSGAVNSIALWVESLSYVPGANLFWERGGHMDIYYDNVFAVQDGRIVLLGAGQFGAEDNTRPGAYTYSWQGRQGTEAEYLSGLQAVFPMQEAQFAGQEACGREEILAQLDEMS